MNLDPPARTATPGIGAGASEIFLSGICDLLASNSVQAPQTPRRQSRTGEDSCQQADAFGNGPTRLGTARDPTRPAGRAPSRQSRWIHLSRQARAFAARGAALDLSRRATEEALARGLDHAEVKPDLLGQPHNTTPLCRRAREGESKESRGEGGRPVTPDQVVISD